MRRIRVELARFGLVTAAALALTLGVGSSTPAHETGAQHVHFQKPQRTATASTAGVQFRSVSAAETEQAEPVEPTKPAAKASTTASSQRPSTTQRPAAGVNPLRTAKAPAPAKTAANDAVVRAAFNDAPQQQTAPAVRTAVNIEPVADRSAVRQAPRPSYVSDPAPTQRVAMHRDLQAIGTNQGRFAASAPQSSQVQQATFLRRRSMLDPGCAFAEPGCGVMEPTCGCGEPSCGIMEPGCGIVEPGCGIMEPACGCTEPSCGIMEPGCGIVEPGCGIYEPGCGIAEPDCGCDVGCGSCVEGPDYWCFPVCLPRLKELRVWGGVHGFKGPRDAPAFGGAGDGNFGFQQGINIAGKAPIIHHLFPGISYQLGYQGVQSQLSGSSSGSTSDRSQQFVTAGLFRRVHSGLQFGAVWDYMNDDFIADASLQQVRYEISLKSPRGREIGFMGATHLDTATVGAITYQTVDQYVGFLRWTYNHGGNFRIWGGGTNDSEGIFGAEFWYPCSGRWSVQSGFNYLITDKNAGVNGSREESWNIGINVFWHWGARAKANCGSPYQPLFSVADNGWMFVDQVP
ncbi:MAG: hypothetical protein KF688_06395 [Pirellulales bacterium]|nr:hypothetical protein [Pirellulales bacterium]